MSRSRSRRPRFASVRITPTTGCTAVRFKPVFSPEFYAIATPTTLLKDPLTKIRISCIVLAQWCQISFLKLLWADAQKSTVPVELRQCHRLSSRNILLIAANNAKIYKKLNDSAAGLKRTILIASLSQN